MYEYQNKKVFYSISTDTGRTSKSRQKKIDKDGKVTYIKNKTTIGSSKISFKAAKNINIYNNGVITQPKTAATSMSYLFVLSLML
jgi:hypothetical protein